MPSVEEGAGAPLRDPSAASQGTSRCPSDLRLVASVVNMGRPQLSLAVVRNGAGARMLAIGGRVDALTLVALQPHYAELRDAAGARCILPVFDPSVRAQAKPGPAAKPPVAKLSAPATPNGDPKPRALFTPDELTRGLRAIDADNYVLARELLLKALKNPGGAAGGAHFRLIEREGKSVGMEVRAVRDGSVLSRMGLRTGDVVKSVNGIDVSTPTGLLSVLRAAREADAVTLSIVQEGKERALRYLIE